MFGPDVYPYGAQYDINHIPNIITPHVKCRLRTGGSADIIGLNEALCYRFDEVAEAGYKDGVHYRAQDHVADYV